VFVAQAAAAVFQVGFELAEAFLFGVTRALFLLFVADVGSFGNERRTGGVDGVRLARQLAVFQQAGEEVYVGGGGRGGGGGGGGGGRGGAEGMFRRVVQTF